MESIQIHVKTLQLKKIIAEKMQIGLVEFTVLLLNVKIWALVSKINIYFFIFVFIEHAFRKKICILDEVSG